eukprot:g2960.t1
MVLLLLSTISPYSGVSSLPRLSVLPCLKFRAVSKATSPLQPPRDLRPDAVASKTRKQGFIVQALFKPDGQDERSSFGLVRQISGPVTALLVCALLSGAVIPEEALAARSGGRIGGSAFRSRAPSMPSGGGGSYRQYNYYSSPGIAPPLVGGYGYGIMPSFFFPIGFGGIFNIFIALFLISSVFNAIRDFQQRKDDEDDFDDIM